MELEQTPLWDEVLKIFAKGPTSTNFAWQVIVHTPVEDLTPLNLDAVNVVRDYHMKFGDVTTISMLFGMGRFARRIYPHRDKLEVTLKRIPILENQDQQADEGQIQAERFTAVLLGDSHSPTVAQGTESNDEFALDLSGVVDVHFQLLDKAFEQVRLIQTGGVVRGANMQNILTTLLTTLTGTVKVGAERGMKGVSMTPADNKSAREQIVLPHGTRLVDLPDHLQTRFGIYNSGLGTYVQNGHWYIFPLYDTSEFNKRTRTLTLLVLPERKLSSVDRTFKVEAGCLTALVTGQTAFRDDAGTNSLNYGNGVRFSNAESFMDQNSNTAGNKTTLSRKDNNSEFTTQDATLAYAPVADTRITANPFVLLTMQAAKRGGMFKAVWENSDLSLLYPGMPVKVMYSDKGELREIYGILHKASNVSMKPGGMTSRTFKNTSVLEIFVNNQLKPISQ